MILGVASLVFPLSLSRATVKRELLHAGAELATSVIAAYGAYLAYVLYRR